MDQCLKAMYCLLRLHVWVAMDGWVMGLLVVFNITGGRVGTHDGQGI